MKKVFTFLTTALLLTLCSCEKEPIGADRIFMYGPDEQEEANLYFSSHARKIKYEGHWYIFFRDGWSDSSRRTAAFAHDANCWCRAKLMEDAETIAIVEE